MMHFFASNMAPIMFASLIVFLLFGYPVAFALGACGLFFGVVGVEMGLMPQTLLQALPLRIFGIMQNDTLLAVPFFTLMGLILERSGMAEDLLDTIGQLFGPIRGGLAFAVILVGAMLAATTGVVAASVISMGLISLPIMLRYGYDRRVASGVIAASGTLAQIIPPSLVLIVMADQLGRSVGDMYEGAFLPGLALAAMYAGYIFIVSVLYPKAAPGLPVADIGFREPDGARGVWQLGVLVIFAGLVSYYLMRGTGVRAGADFVVLCMSLGVVVSFFCSIFNRMFGARQFYVIALLFVVFLAVWYWLDTHNHENWAILLAALTAGAFYSLVAAVIERATGFRLISAMAEQTTFVMVPPLALIFLVLGTIFIGLATPTEGGAMGASGALILALMKRRLTFDLTRQAVESTAKLSSFVVFILVGARVFSLTFYGVDGHRWVEEMLVSLPGGQVGFLIFVNVFIFFLAFFLDFFEIAFIVIPLLGPAAERIGIDLIWFGVMLGVNMQTSFMHPPFGFALFYLRSVAPREAFIDRVSGKRTEGVTTGQIYWGAVPFVIIQCIGVGLVIAFPSLVMHYKGAGTGIDPSKVKIEIEAPPDLPPLDFGQPPPAKQ